MITVATIQGGGAERVAVVWANTFRKMGHEVVLATDVDALDAPFIYSVDKEVTLSKCFIHKKGKTLERDIYLRKKIGFPYRVYSSFFYYCKCHFALRREIKRFQPDVILGVMNQTSLQTLIASLGLGCKVVSTEHNSFERPVSAPMSGMMHFLKFKANKWFPLVSVLTTEDKNYIGKSLTNVEVMPNPLAIVPLSVPLSPKKKRILAAGRLSAWHCKGFDVLIKSWGQIAHKYPEWCLDIAGTGDEKSITYLQNIIKEQNIESQTVLSGFHKDMAKYYAEAEIFVLSSRYEGFGMVLIEAMSQGCACVAADYKGRQKEIFGSNEFGICVNPGNIVEMSEAIEKLIKNKELRTRMQQKAIERSKDFLPNIIGKRWIEIIHDKLYIEEK